MYNLLIRNARIARQDGNTFEGDVACEDGRIARIDPTITAAARETINTSSKLLIPGVIDPQVHFREPGNEHKEDLGSGSRAAVRGGVTSFPEIPNTTPPTTTQAALDEKLARADKPAWVTAEAIPNHLLLSSADYVRLGNLVQMNPPIRSPQDNAALWAGLHDGTIDFIVADHAPQTLEEKKPACPNTPSGMPGVETSLPLMLTAMHEGRCTLAEIQKWMCYDPAEAYRIPNKGKILEGWDADLAFVDIEHTQSVRNDETFTKVRWSPWNGCELRGRTLYTIVNGEIAFDNGRIHEQVRGRPLTYLH